MIFANELLDKIRSHEFGFETGEDAVLQLIAVDSKSVAAGSSVAVICASVALGAHDGISPLTKAAPILGDLIDEVRLTPEEDGSLKAELFGDLAAMLAYAQHEKKSPDSEKPGRELSLVAGARNPRQLTLEAWV